MPSIILGLRVVKPRRVSSGAIKPWSALCSLWVGCFGHAEGTAWAHSLNDDGDDAADHHYYD